MNRNNRKRYNHFRGANMDATDYLILDLLIKGSLTFVVVSLIAAWFFRDNV